MKSIYFINNVFFKSIITIYNFLSNLLRKFFFLSPKIKKEKCVYTCITGDYDELICYQYIDSDYDYICFTDNKKLLKKKQIGAWKIKKLRYKKSDNVRNARWHKTHPHILFSQYIQSFWIDASIDIKTDKLFNIIEEREKESDILIPIHFKRSCIYDECEACISGKKDSFEIIEKTKKFLEQNGMPPNYGLNETGIIWRRHHNPNIIKLMEEWWYLILNYSRRDQLSLSYLLYKNGIKVEDISIPNIRNDFDNYMLYVNHNVKRKSKHRTYNITGSLFHPCNFFLELFRFIRDYNLLKKSDLFDTEYYLANNEDVRKAKKNPILHYLRFGWKEGRNPSEKFDSKAYLKQRPDVKVAGICPLVHYLKFGKNNTTFSRNSHHSQSDISE